MNGNKLFSAKDAKDAKEREEKQMALARDGNIHWIFLANLRVLRGSSLFNGEA